MLSEEQPAQSIYQLNVSDLKSGIYILHIQSDHFKLKFCVSKVGSGVTPRGGAAVYQNEGIIFLRSQNIHNDGLRLNEVAFISELIHSEMSSSQVKKDDVLLNLISNNG